MPDKKQQYEEGEIIILAKSVGEWERQPHPSFATSFGKGAWARTVTVIEGFLGDEPPDKDGEDAGR